MNNPLWGPDWDEVRRHWTFEPGVTYLNHGSFGATPRPVLKVQQALRELMERQLIQFLDRERDERFEVARSRVGELLGSDPANITFVPNATFGINAVLKSLPFEAGDELLIPEIGYGAIIKTVRRVCDRTGATFVLQNLPFPKTPQDLVDSVMSGVTERTKIVVVDQVASASALVFPVAEIIAACHARGVEVMVDGAHAPGQLPLSLDELGADYWTGNLHKWVCAPKGSAILYVSPQHQDKIEPLVTSHYINDGFLPSFEWQGTTDPTSFLATPAAVDFMESLGWDRVRTHNHELVKLGRRTICEATGLTAPIPEACDALVGSMAVITLPDGLPENGAQLQAEIYSRSKVEVPVMWNHERPYIRISAQVYNCPDDYARLGMVLAQILQGA